MRLLLLLSVVLIGGALLAFGIYLDNVWIGVPGVALLTIATSIWIMSPARRTPVERGDRPTRDGGNRPTHDPTDFVGWD